MPKSKHRKKRASGSNARPAAPPKPTPSPKWVPHVGIGLIAAGTLVVIVTYIAAVANWLVLVGFVLMGAGLVALSQLR